MNVNIFLAALFYLSKHKNIGVRADICGKYSVLTEVDSFYISQPFTQQISIDFQKYIETFSNLNENIYPKGMSSL